MKRASFYLGAAMAVGLLRSDARAGGPSWPQATSSSAPSPVGDSRPTIFIAGDSTAEKGVGEQQGWGGPFVGYFDPRRVRVVNRARAGRSTRTFISEGLWAQLLGELRPGDTVLIQFGFNDSGAINGEPPPPPARGTLRGTDDSTLPIENVATGAHEVVHTYGWYLRKMIGDVQARQGRPILLSLTLRNFWHDGRVERGLSQYRAWTARVADETHVPFIDVTSLMANEYTTLGEAAVRDLYLPDRVHFNRRGAERYAALIATQLSYLPGGSYAALLSAKGFASAAPDREERVKP